MKIQQTTVPMVTEIFSGPKKEKSEERKEKKKERVKREKEN